MRIKNAIFFACLLLYLPPLWAQAPVTNPTTAPAADQLKYTQLLARMKSADALERDCAIVDLEWLPESVIPLIEQTANADDTDAEVRTHLQNALPRMKDRYRYRNRVAAQRKAAKPMQLKLMRAAYDNDGHSSPACDNAAHDFLERECQVSDWTDEQSKQCNDAIKQIRAAHCDDPTILTEMLLIQKGDTDKDPDTYNQFVRIQKIAEAGKCDPYTKIIIDGRNVRGRSAGLGGGLRQDNYREYVRTWNDMCSQFLALLKTPDLQLDLVHEVASNISKTGESNMLPHEHLLNDVYPALPAIYANDPELLATEGRNYVDYAWEARGGGLANTVGDAQWQLFYQRLTAAETYLTHAYTLDPYNPSASRDMLSVMLGKDTNLPEMEKWFERAMTANPDDYAACGQKLLYLEPKWHGNPALMLAFAHQCFEKRDWRGDIPFILCQAHYSLCQYFPDRGEYFQKGSVWGDLNLVYTTYLRLYPNNAWGHVNYAYYATLCHKYKTADEQFDLAGDKCTPGLFNTVEQYQHCKAETKQRVQSGQGDSP